MKKTTRSEANTTTWAALVGAGLILFLMTTGTLLTAQPPASDEAPVDNWAAVTAQLNEGGVHYTYIETDGRLKRLVGKLTEAFVPPGSNMQRLQVANGIDRVFDMLGLYAIDAIGISTISRDDFYHHRVFVHVPEGTDAFINGMLSEPHEFAIRSYAPQTALLVGSWDVKMGHFMRTVQGTLPQIAPQVAMQAHMGISMADAWLAQSGQPTLLDLLSQLDGPTGFILMADESQTLTITGEMLDKPDWESVEMPLPHLALFFEPSEPGVYDRILTLMRSQGIVFQEETRGGSDPVRVARFAVPPNDYYELSPVLALHGDHLILAARTDTLDQLLTVRRGEVPSLTEDADYQKISAGLSDTGNGWAFASPRLDRYFFDFAEKMSRNFSGEEAQQFAQVRAQLGQAFGEGAATVSRNLDNGILFQQNSYNAGGGAGVGTNSMVVVAVVGILAAIAVPSFIKARETAQANACMEAQEKFEGALANWALDEGKTGEDHATWPQIVGREQYLIHMPVCPVGNTPLDINTRVKDVVTCPNNIPSHERKY